MYISRMPKFLNEVAGLILESIQNKFWHPVLIFKLFYVIKKEIKFRLKGWNMADAIKKEDLAMNRYYVVISEMRMLIVKCRGIAHGAVNIYGPALNLGGINRYEGVAVISFEEILRQATHEEVTQAKKSAHHFIDEF